MVTFFLMTSILHQRFVDWKDHFLVSKLLNLRSFKWKMKVCEETLFLILLVFFFVLKTERSLLWAIKMSNQLSLFSCPKKCHSRRFFRVQTLITGHLLDWFLWFLEKQHDSSTIYATSNFRTQKKFCSGELKTFKIEKYEDLPLMKTSCVSIFTQRRAQYAAVGYNLGWKRCFFQLIQRAWWIKFSIIAHKIPL